MAMSLTFEESRTSMTAPGFALRLSPSILPEDRKAKARARMDDKRAAGALTPDVLQRSLAGEPAALELLVEQLTPIIQARVARSLLRCDNGLSASEIRQIMGDMTQEMFMILFKDEAKILRDWNPGRGLSLENFVGLVTERRVLSILRRARRNPWTEEPTEPSTLDRRSQEAGPERTAASRERLDLILDRFRSELSPLGWDIFNRLFLHQESVERITAETGLSRDAVYAWRSRLRRLARRLMAAEEPARG